jgi:exodeoxyribonuclease-3
MFSWWDYRAADFCRNRGLPIDLIFASLSLADHCQQCDIGIAPQKLERPSDHTPVLVEFKI